MDRLRDHSCFWYFRVSTPTCNILKTQTLSVHAGLFECFHNPPNNDMDYKIFGVCMWFLLFLLLRVYTHVYLTEEASKSKAQSLSIAMDYKCIYMSMCQKVLLRRWTLEWKIKAEKSFSK